MSDETPVEGEAFEAPEVEVAEETPKRKRTARAKPLHEEEMERKSKEAHEARTVGRARPLAEIDREDAGGDSKRIVMCRVLARGEGRIHTGEIDPVTNRGSFYAQGENIEIAEPQAFALERRAFVEIVR